MNINNAFHHIRDGGLEVFSKVAQTGGDVLSKVVHGTGDVYHKLVSEFETMIGLEDDDEPRSMDGYDMREFGTPVLTGWGLRLSVYAMETRLGNWAFKGLSRVSGLSDVSGRKFLHILRRRISLLGRAC